MLSKALVVILAVGMVPAASYGHLGVQEAYAAENKIKFHGVQSTRDDIQQTYRFYEETALEQEEGQEGEQSFPNSLEDPAGDTEGGTERLGEEGTEGAQQFQEPTAQEDALEADTPGQTGVSGSQRDEANSCIASFSFDGEETGLVDAKTGAKAITQGTMAFEPTEKMLGKSLYFDGSNYLTVIDRDGNSLLADYGQATISYWSKVDKADSSKWSFMVKKAESDVFARRYVGALDGGESVGLERASADGGSPATWAGNANDEWKLVTVVLTEDKTQVYINKNLAGTGEANLTLGEIFEGNSELRIGMAEWGGGEYFKGYMDEFKVYNYALSQEEITAYYDGVMKAQFFERDEPNSCIASFNFDDEETGFVDAKTRAKAVAQGTTVLTADEKIAGQALQLDGSNYLMATDRDGNSLLGNYEEATVSYWSKSDVNAEGAKWGFMVKKAGSDVLARRYIGSIDNGDWVTIERSDGKGNSPSIGRWCSNNEWKLVTVVLTGDKTKLYINKDLAAEGEAAATVGEINEGDSEFRIGMAEWGNGEYFKGYMDEFKVYNYALSQEEIAAYYDGGEDQEDTCIASFTFDSEEEGFVDAVTGAKAESKSVNMLSGDERMAGKALYLDGGSNYLTVTDKDGNSLLADYKQATISYWSKVDKADGSKWSFMVKRAGSDMFARRYVGALDGGESIGLERADANEGSPAIWSGNANNEWKLVTVVLTEDKTEVYINQSLASTGEADATLGEIFEGGSEFRIGMAEWGGGEYFKGYMDEFRVYNYALSQEEIAAYYEQVTAAKANIDQARAAEVIEEVNKIGTVVAEDACRKRIEEARSAYDALTEAQKQLVTNAGILEKAEEDYRKLAEEQMVSVVFLAKNGTVIERADYPAGLAEGSGIRIPTAPIMDGYSLKGWILKGNCYQASDCGALQAAILSCIKEKEDVSVQAEYGQLTAEYQVKAEKGTLTDGQAEGTYQVSEIVEVTADQAEEGKQFSHWEKNGVIVSYNAKYSFFMPSENVMLKAVYVDTEQKVERKGTAVMERVNVDTAGKSISFVALCSVPEGCSIVSAGLVATSDPEKASNLTAANADYVRTRTTSSYTYKYTWTKTNVGEGQNWYARPYLVYKDSTGCEATVYGSLASANLEGSVD